MNYQRSFRLPITDRKAKVLWVISIRKYLIAGSITPKRTLFWNRKQVELDSERHSSTVCMLRRGTPYLSLNRISWLRNRGWKLSESTPLFQRRILLAKKNNWWACIPNASNKICGKHNIKRDWARNGQLILPAVTRAANKSLLIAAEGTNVRSAALWRNSEPIGNRLAASHFNIGTWHRRWVNQWQAYVLIIHHMGVTSQLKVYLGIYLHQNQ